MIWKNSVKNLILTLLVFALLPAISACGKLSGDKSGPEIKDIQTSGNVLVISDCSGTSVTISTKVTDPSSVKKVRLWYRTGTDQQFVSTDLDLKEGVYKVDLNGPDFLGRPYGTLEFYITAEDKAGNLSKSPINQSVQFLPCVNN
jgi:hypothetical protein